MKFSGQTTWQYEELWSTSSKAAPKALRGALTTLADGQPVLASHIDYHSVPDGKTTWAGVWLLADSLAYATATDRSRGVAAWDYSYESQHPSSPSSNAVVTGSLWRLKDIESINLASQSTWSTDAGGIETASKWIVAVAGDAITFPLINSDMDLDNGHSYDAFIQSLRTSWLTT